MKYECVGIAKSWSGPKGTMNEGYLTLTELNMFYDYTARDIGDVLKQLGYRTSAGEPSPKAFSLGLVAPRFGMYTTDRYNWAWHMEKTLPILDTVLTRRSYNAR